MREDRKVYALALLDQTRALHEKIVKLHQRVRISQELFDARRGLDATKQALQTFIDAQD